MLDHRVCLWQASFVLLVLLSGLALCIPSCGGLCSPDLSASLTSQLCIDGHPLTRPCPVLSHSDNQPRAGPSASSRNKGKQKAPDPESEEEEQESESGKGPPARKRVKRESAASKPKQEETQSSGKSRMSGKGKPRGASKKQPK